MKKIIFTIITVFLFLTNVSAFNVNIDKIEIGKKSEKLVKNLNSSYKIDTTGFNNQEIIIDNELKKLVTNLTKETLSDHQINEKKKYFSEYGYYGSNGGETLASLLFIETFLQKIEEENISSDTIKEIKAVTFNENDILVFVYLNDTNVNTQKEINHLVYWIKKDNDKYCIYFPWLTLSKEIDTYYDNISNNEEQGEIVGGTFKGISLTGNSNSISNDELRTIYNNNYNSVVEITGMSGTGKSMYGSGFFLREGVVVTTWSLFLEFLNNSNYIFVNDANGNTYEVLGVIAAEIDYDVVVLKINSNSGHGVIFDDSTKLTTDDTLFMINSKNNSGFSISYGTYISATDGHIKNMFLLKSSDVGSALFTKDGKVVGITVADKLNSELSYANSTNYLQRLQTILNNQVYEKISYTVLDTFKQTYYTEFNSEKSYNYVKNNIYEKYVKIGSLDKNVPLDLIKASYVDHILSLRYKCDTNNMINSMFLMASYTEQLVLDGYKLTYEDDYKKIYQNNKYKIIIKDKIQYIIILIMEK